jgi:hypothetical protein
MLARRFQPNAEREWFFVAEEARRNSQRVIDMSSPRSALRGASGSRVRTPLWSLTLPDNLNPLFFFTITAVGLFAVLGIGVRHTAGIEWVLVSMGPAYALLFYLIRSVVSLVRAGLLVHAGPAVAHPERPAGDAFRSAERTVRISRSPGEPRTRGAAPAPATDAIRTTPMRDACRNAS